VLSVWGGNKLTVDGTGTTTIAAIISGTAGNGITKNGTGTLALNGANTFNGGLTVNAGTVSTSAAAGFGAGAISLGDTAVSNTNAATLLTTNGATHANNITVNAGSSGLLSIQGKTNSQTFSGNITLNNNLTLAQLTAGQSTTFSGNITGGSVLSIGNTGITNAGTVILSGVANTYNGGTVVNSGTLTPTLAAALSGYNSAGKVIFAGGTISTLLGDGVTTGWSTGQVDALLGNATKTSGAIAIDTTNGSAALGSAVSGGIGLTKLGTNTLTLNQANNYTGATTVAGGTLILSGAAGLSDTATANVTASGAILDISGISASSETVGSLAGATGSSVEIGAKSLTVGDDNTSTTFAGILSGASGSLTKNGSGTMTLNPTIARAVTTTANSTVVTMADTTGVTIGQLISGTGIAAGTKVTAIGAGNVTISANATAGGSVTANVGVDNTYTGGTTLNAGTLNLLQSGSLGTGGLVINGGTLAQTAAGGYTVALSTNNAITVNADFGGNIASNAGLDLGTGNVNLGTTAGTSRTITVTGGTLFIGGNITDGTTANQLIKAGTGTLDLSGNSTSQFTGGAVIKQGTLNLGNGAQTSGGNAVAAGNATITLGDAAGGDARLTTGSFTVANNIQLGTGAVGTLSIGTTGATRNPIFNGNIDVNGNSLTLLNSGTSKTTFNGNFTGTGSGNLTATLATGNITINGNIGSGINDVTTSSSAGILTLNGTNTYTGNTTIGATATLKVNSAAALGSGTKVVINQNGTLINTANMTLSKDVIAVGASNGINPTANTTLTITGKVDTSTSGTGQFIIASTGAVELTNSANTFRANTNLLIQNAGLFLGHANAVNGALLKFNGGTSRLDNTSGSAMTVTSLSGFSLTTGFTFVGTDDLDLSAAQTGFTQTVTAKTITVNAKTLTMNGIQSTGTDASGAAYFDAPLIKAGNGTLVLTGASTYTLGTTIDGGTLQIGNGGTTGSLSTSGAITNNGTLAFKRSDTVTQGTHFASVIGGTGNVTQSGTGTLDLSGTNTFTGATLVTAGTMVVSGSINTSSGVQVDGGTFNYTNGATALNRSVTVNSGGTFKYNSSSVFAGTLTLNSGSTLGGSGDMSGTSVIIASGVTLSPGNSPGNLTTGAESWENGGDYNWQLFDATAGPGIGGWDLITVTGALDLSSLTANGFNLNLWTLSSITPDTNGTPNSFTNTSNYSWKIATATGGITGFNAANFKIWDTANNGAGGFSGGAAGSSFNVTQVGNDLYLNYVAVPEPAAWLLAAFGLTTAVVFRRRRQD